MRGWQKELGLTDRELMDGVKRTAGVANSLGITPSNVSASSGLQNITRMNVFITLTRSHHAKCDRSSNANTHPHSQMAKGALEASRLAKKYN
jgi:hypothetical protein